MKSIKINIVLKWVLKENKDSIKLLINKNSGVGSSLKKK